MSRKEILDRFRTQVAEGRPIIGGGAPRQHQEVLDLQSRDNQADRYEHTQCPEEADGER